MTMPSVRSSATVAGNTNGSANTITRAGGVLDTDYVLIIPTAGAGSNASAAPAGFDTVIADTVTQGARVACYGKVVGSDTSWSLTYPTAPGSGNNIRITVIYLIKAAGVGAKSAAIAPSVAATSLAVPSVTTTGPDQLVLFYAMNKASSTAWATTVSVAGGSTISASNFPGNTFNPATTFATLAETNPTATGVQTFTWDLSTINQGGFAIAVLPSEVALTLSGVMTPPSADVGVARTLTLTAAGGNGTTITYGPVDWGDGLTASAAQSSNVFTRTPTTAQIGRTWTASATQSA